MFQQARRLSIRIGFLLTIFVGLFSMTTFVGEAHAAIPSACITQQWITVGIHDVTLEHGKSIAINIHLQLQELVDGRNTGVYCGRMIANAYATDPVQGTTHDSGELKAWVSPNVGDSNPNDHLSPIADCFVPTGNRNPVCPLYAPNIYLAGGPGHSGAVSSSVCVQAYGEYDSALFGTNKFFAPAGNGGNGYCIHG